MISLRAYARHRGCRLSTVQDAIRAGRLSRAVTRDAKGSPKITDAATADREWAATTRAEHVPVATIMRKATLPPADVAVLVDRLEALMAELQADSRATAAEYLPFLVAGAAEALAVAGRPVTLESVGRALDRGEDSAGLPAPLLTAVDDMDADRRSLRDLARRIGREAVLELEALSEAAEGADADGER